LATRHIFSDPTIRKRLASPLGSLVSEREALKLAGSCEEDIITVGDVVSRFFLENGVRPRIVIFDEKTHREASGEFPRELLVDYELRFSENPPGTISEESFSELKRLISISGQFALKISGEEDLLGLPAIEVAPVGSLVFYGQPDRGIVAVRVNSETRGIARSILEKSRVK
jgi:uncharacterized protein (UPF0218 family)